MAESRIPKAARKVLGQLAKGVITVAEASTALGAALDKKFGTEKKSLFRPSDPSKRSKTYKTTATGKKPRGGAGR
jgi:hypothetical protein